MITCHTSIDHPQPIFQQQGLPWHVGRRQQDHVNVEFSKDYDELKAMTSIPKTKILSVISSSKTMSEGHRKRLDFAKRLKLHFGDQVDLFGRELNEIEDKWDALADYQYHVALENSTVKDYWTEKLSDAFLAACHPIYYGCPNISRYFDPASLTPIDLDHPERAIAVIESCIEQKRYESSEQKIWEAREKVLDTHNLFALIADYEDMVKLYSQSKINLGFGGVESHPDTFCLKGRDFEIPMSGGLYLTEDHPELSNAFRIGEEILTYSGMEDLNGKILYYLQHPLEMDAIRKKGATGRFVSIPGKRGL